MTTFRRQPTRPRQILAFGCVGLFVASSGVTRSATGQTELVKDATYPEAFSLIGGIRELPNGRLMVADPLGQVLVVVDLATGAADTIGGVGGGPQEYRQPDGVFALPGDSTLLIDLGNTRITVIDPQGRFGQTMPLVQGQPGGPGFTLTIPRFVDARGRVYYRAGGNPMADSADIVRSDRGASEPVTLGKVMLQARQRRESGGPNNRSVQIRPVPMSPEDDWAVGPDGRLALISARNYSVRWIEPDGRVTAGSPVPYRPISIGSDEKEAWIEELATTALSMSVTVTNGRPQMGVSRGGGARSSAADYQWPETMPAFRAGRSRVTPTGDLWVERYVAAGSNPQIDVFGSDGNRKRTMTLPAGRSVVGFGQNDAVYLSYRDEFDLQYLERYRQTGAVKP